MYRLRLFASRNAGSFARLYTVLETILVRMDPIFARIGYARAERIIVPIEKLTKSLLFDCQMCGQCVLSSTGMSCPMNCPKTLRNGPCGGVRPGGFCEVKPEMKCVWVLAWDGAARMRDGNRIREVLPAIDHRLKGRSAWLRESRARAAKAQASRGAPHV